MLMDFIPSQFHPYLAPAAVLLLLLCGLLIMLVVVCFLRLRSQARAVGMQAQQLSQERKLNADMQAELHQQQLRNAKLLTLLKTERRSTGEKLTILEDARKHLLLQFQSLAQRIFEEKSVKFGNDSKERLTSLLQPLQDQLRSFQQRIDDIQVNDIRERTSLKQEIIHLRELNTRINTEAVNLTRALRGDKKKQGNWGELVLERVLEKSGLRRDREYSVQTGYRSRELRLQRPDIIIHLPEKKDIIIDSKVSLSAWEKYVNSDDEQERRTNLASHLANIRNHIEDLAGKNYCDLPDLHSLDFVLLFIPIDSSFATACEADEQLFADAYEKRVIIVTPTTLLATLKTIENLWRYEHQNRNAKEIADRAGALYDKLRGFVEEMEKIGRQLAACHTTYESAMNKLTTGRGNIIAQAERFTELGVKVRKKIPDSLSSNGDADTVN